MEQAVTWIVEHESDPDLDQPLLLPEVRKQDKQSDAGSPNALWQQVHLLRSPMPAVIHM